MKYRSLLIALSAFVSLASPLARAEIPHATTGFYPIWENTGTVEAHRRIKISTTGAQFGIENRAHIGVMPVNFAYRTPNAYAKFLILDQDHWNVSTQIGAYALLEGAAKSFASPMYSSRISNPNHSLLLFPVQLSGTWYMTDWFRFHATASILFVRGGGNISDDATLGHFVTGELLASKHNSLLAHLGTAGIVERDFTMAGFSYRYQGSFVEFRLGYFYRIRSVGAQSAILPAIGISL